MRTSKGKEVGILEWFLLLAWKLTVTFYRYCKRTYSLRESN